MTLTSSPAKPFPKIRVIPNNNRPLSRSEEVLPIISSSTKKKTKDSHEEAEH